MASKLFAELYQQAARLDCPTIYKLAELAAGPKGEFFPFRTTKMVPLVDVMLADWTEFKDKLHQVAVRNGLYRRTFKERCPGCGQADCPGALPVIAMQFSSPQALQEFLLKHGFENGK